MNRRFQNSFLFSIFFWLLLINSSILAQSIFQQTLGGQLDDQAFEVQITPDKGYIIVGYQADTTTSFDIFLVKLSDLGDTVWSRNYGGSSGEKGYSVCNATDGGYGICGYSQSFGTGGFSNYFLKVDQNGDTMFTKIYDGSAADFLYTVLQTSDKGFLLGGTSNSYGAGGNDMYLIKTDSLGFILWSRTYGGINNENLYDAEETSDSGFILVGGTTSFGPGTEGVYLIRTNSNGDTLWTKSYGGSAQDYAESVAQTQDSGFIVTGRTYSFGAGNSDVLLFKTDASGNLLWTKTYGTTALDYGASIDQTPDGGSVITGSSFAGFSSNLYLIRTDPIGDTLWTKVYGTPAADEGYSVRYMPNDSGFIAVGSTLGMGAGGYDFYILKTDSNGNTIGCGQVAMSTIIGTPAMTENATATMIGSGAIVINPPSIVKNTSDVITRLGLSISLSKTNVTCNSGNDGSANIDVSCGLAPFSFLWSNGQTDPLATGLSSGTYYVTVTDNYGNSVEDSILITEPWPMSISFYPTYELCTGSDGAVYSVVSGGTMPYNWNWSTGDSTQHLIWVKAGTYLVTVTDANGCGPLVDSATVVYAEDTINLSFTTSYVSCQSYCNDTATVVATGGNLPYTYLWDDPLGQITDMATNLCGGKYTVTVTDLFGCQTIDSVFLNIYPLPPQPVCLITVDSTSTKNVIAWEKPVTAGIDSFRIYRDIVGVYTHIGSVPYSTLSEFADTTNGIDPNITSYRYKISAIDTCGRESALSAHHKTIHLVVVPGVPPKMELLWADYEGFSFTYYRILRDSPGPGGWQVIDSVSFGINSYSDLIPPQNSRYMVEVIPPYVCTSSKMSTFYTAQSNIACESYPCPSDTTAIKENWGQGGKIIVYPNPFNSTTTFEIVGHEFKNPLSFELYDVVGKRVKLISNISGKKFTLSNEGLSTGIYLYKINSKENLIGAGKLMVNGSILK